MGGPEYSKKFQRTLLEALDESPVHPLVRKKEKRPSSQIVSDPHPNHTRSSFPISEENWTGKELPTGEDEPETEKEEKMEDDGWIKVGANKWRFVGNG